VVLNDLPDAELWQEILARIELSQEYFTHYSDRRFLEIRDRTEQRVNELVGDALGDDSASAAVTGKLLGQLGSLTDEKQRQLRNLARIYGENGDKSIQEAPEWQAFIDQFGSESPTTHLFYLPTLKESSDLVVEMIKQISREPGRSKNGENWQDVAATISTELPESKRAEFTTELDRLRRCLLRTENDDYALSRCTMIVRDAYLEAGRRLAETGLLDRNDDVFHLAGAELSQALTGTLETATRARVEERRKQFEKSRSLSPPPMIVNGRAMVPKAEKPASTLRGTPASPGVASGIVLVLNDPFGCVAKRLPGNAVVVAPIVTPSLAYSLIGCSAVVTEIGGLASHGAIVARELAIPAVVGVGRARTILQTGMSVTVDGTQGEINILGTQQ
jgi:pyruvate,water dikinase